MFIQASISTDTSSELFKNFGPSNFTHVTHNDESTEKPQTNKTPSIRERLASWTPPKGSEEHFELPSDGGITGKSPNSVAKSQTSGSHNLNTMRPNVEGMTDYTQGGRTINHDFEVGVDSRQPGDLVEIRQYGARNPVFAVYLGFFGGRNHFYSSSGRWFITVGYGSLFTVANFASAVELAPILAELPKCTTPEDFDIVRDENRGPTRASAAHLIDKMDKFMSSAQAVYLGNMESLDTARMQLSDPERVKYFSLFEIAEMLLPGSLKSDGIFAPSALYAVHTALYRDEIAFRPLSPTSDCHRRDHLFEVFPHSFMQTINRTAVMVRNYCEARAHLTGLSARKALEQTPFGSFIDKARQTVTLNRRHSRDWTSHGVLMPSSKSSKLAVPNWSFADKEIISFLQWWASYELFEPSSRFPAYGATILRALDVYDNVPLDQSLAWTFLQEIGIIEPWEVPSRYRVRFPDTGIVKGGGLARLVAPNLSDSTRRDIASEFRIHLKDRTVYAIDGPDTVMIDDGISLEPTDKDNEFWIHVHAADPASGIEPISDFSKFMELIPENIYLQGHFQAMMSPSMGGGPTGDIQALVKQYSLSSGRPALTFSAKVNCEGDILDYKIAPTKLGVVEYLDPADVSKLCGEPEPPSWPSYELAVGTPPPPPPPPPEESLLSNRKMKAAEDLLPAQKDELLTMYKLAGAIKEKRLKKGAWPYFFPSPSVKVQFHPAEVDEDVLPSNQPKLVRPQDPYIKVSNEKHAQSSLVANTMVLAGEIAARWCADRGISVPFRRDAKSVDNYDIALKYAKEVVYPQIDKGKEPSMEERGQLAILTGAVQISTTPGPYFIMGLDMYLKTTSPLRRFSDLLAHWQIHAALAHERELGRPINPKVDDLNAILPFSLPEMENKISLLHMREKMARRVSRGDRDWILMALVRAWRFEKTAPQKFRFTVHSRWKPGLLGHIDWFGLNASMDIAGLEGKVLLRNIKVGDQFDVELLNVNVHSGEIEVRALEYHPTPANVVAQKLGETLAS